MPTPVQVKQRLNACVAALADAITQAKAKGSDFDAEKCATRMVKEAYDIGMLVGSGKFPDPDVKEEVSTKKKAPVAAKGKETAPA